MAAPESEVGVIGVVSDDETPDKGGEPATRYGSLIAEGQAADEIGRALQGRDTDPNDGKTDDGREDYGNDQLPRYEQTCDSSTYKERESAAEEKVGSDGACGNSEDIATPVANFDNTATLTAEEPVAMETHTAYRNVDLERNTEKEAVSTETCISEAASEDIVTHVADFDNTATLTAEEPVAMETHTADGNVDLERNTEKEAVSTETCIPEAASEDIVTHVADFDNTATLTAEEPVAMETHTADGNVDLERNTEKEVVSTETCISEAASVEDGRTVDAQDVNVNVDAAQIHEPTLGGGSDAPEVPASAPSSVHNKETAIPTKAIVGCDDYALQTTSSTVPEDTHMADTEETNTSQDTGIGASATTEIPSEEAGGQSSSSSEESTTSTDQPSQSTSGLTMSGLLIEVPKTSKARTPLSRRVANERAKQNALKRILGGKRSWTIEGTTKQNSGGNASVADEPPSDGDAGETSQSNSASGAEKGRGTDHDTPSARLRKRKRIEPPPPGGEAQPSKIPPKKSRSPQETRRSAHKTASDRMASKSVRWKDQCLAKQKGGDKRAKEASVSDSDAESPSPSESGDDDDAAVRTIVSSLFPHDSQATINRKVHALTLLQEGESYTFIRKETGYTRGLIVKWKQRYSAAKTKIQRESRAGRLKAREERAAATETEQGVPQPSTSGIRTLNKTGGLPPPTREESTPSPRKRPAKRDIPVESHKKKKEQDAVPTGNRTARSTQSPRVQKEEEEDSDEASPVTSSSRSSVQSRDPPLEKTGRSEASPPPMRYQVVAMLRKGIPDRQIAEKVGWRLSAVQRVSSDLKLINAARAVQEVKAIDCQTQPVVQLSRCQGTDSVSRADSSPRTLRHHRRVPSTQINAKIPCNIVGTTKCTEALWDGILLVTDKLKKLDGTLAFLKKPLEDLREIDDSVEKDVVLASLGDHAAKRVVFAPTGPLNRDYDDVRRFGDAAGKGMKRALKAGCKSVLLVVPANRKYKEARLVAALGAAHALYVPLEVREANASKASKAEKLGIWAEDEKEAARLSKLTEALESGRLVARDIGGSDPERMSPPKVEEYVRDLFKGSPINVNVISDQAVLDKEYPLHAAVDRCARFVDRHHGRIIELEYEGEGEPDTTLLLVGKGVTYDTGGADIKHGGSMAGMHRDKCGAAAVGGFFQTLALLKPKNIKVSGIMTMVRNSVGADSYVSDEIITARSGVRVRIGNTDAEGRMAMGDPLCKMKDLALTEVNPHIYTIATLTGHAIRAMGPNYSIVLDNGPAKKTKHAMELQTVGEDFGDPFEISSIRREDYEFHAGRSEYEDLLQSNNAPSSATARGHQSPAAFLIMVSGLDKHGIDSDKPLLYSHLDIAGSSGPFPGIPTGAPIVALAAKHLLSRV